MNRHIAAPMAVAALLTALSSTLPAVRPPAEVAMSSRRQLDPSDLQPGTVLLNEVMPRSDASQAAWENDADAGFVFLDGAYGPPPYRLELEGSDITLNGQVVWPGPAHEAPAAAPPASPETAGELIEVAAARYRELGGQPTDEARSALLELLLSFPATAEVEDEGDSLVVTDREGMQAGLALLGLPPPSPEEVLAAQAEQLEDWRALLASGGVLLLSEGASLEVAPQQALPFLGELVAIFDQPEAERSARLEELTGEPTFAAALLAAGPPPDYLRGRLPALVPASLGPAGHADLEPIGLSALSALATFDPASHKLSRTPMARNAYLFIVFSYPSGYRPVARAARLHGYRVVRYAPSGCNPGTATIANFLATSGQAGILYVEAHGAGNAIAIERHCSQAQAQAALQAYLTAGTAKDPRGVPGIRLFNGGNALWDDWHVAISAFGIQRFWRDAGTIVHLQTCSGGFLSRFFNAREFIGPRIDIRACAAFFNNDSFWDRVAGTKDNGTKRNVGDAFQASDLGTSGNYVHVSRANGQTVLSPAVASVNPPEASKHYAGQQVQSTVVFDAEMDTGLAPESAIDLRGSCLPILISARWQDNRTLAFVWQPRAVGWAELRVQPPFAKSRDNGAHLDGNQDPPFPFGDHVNGNGDPYLWQVECIAVLDTPRMPAPTPTPTATPAQPLPPTPTPTPTRSITGVPPGATPASLGAQHGTGQVLVFVLEGISFLPEGLSVIPAHVPFCSYEHVHGPAIRSLVPGPDGQPIVRTEHLGECGFGPPNFYLIADPR